MIDASRLRYGRWAGAVLLCVVLTEVGTPGQAHASEHECRPQYMWLIDMCLPAKMVYFVKCLQHTSEGRISIKSAKTTEGSTEHGYGGGIQGGVKLVEAGIELRVDDKQYWNVVSETEAVFDPNVARFCRDLTETQTSAEPKPETRPRLKARAAGPKPSTSPQAPRSEAKLGCFPLVLLTDVDSREVLSDVAISINGRWRMTTTQSGAACIHYDENLPSAYTLSVQLDGYLGQNLSVEPASNGTTVFPIRLHRVPRPALPTPPLEISGEVPKQPPVVLDPPPVDHQTPTRAGSYFFWPGVSAVAAGLIGVAVSQAAGDGALQQVRDACPKQRCTDDELSHAIDESGIDTYDGLNIASWITVGVGAGVMAVGLILWQLETEENTQSHASRVRARLATTGTNLQLSVAF